jgi:hypothetical protein
MLRDRRCVTDGLAFRLRQLAIPGGHGVTALPCCVSLFNDSHELSRLILTIFPPHCRSFWSARIKRSASPAAILMLEDQNNIPLFAKICLEVRNYVLTVAKKLPRSTKLLPIVAHFALQDTQKATLSSGFLHCPNQSAEPTGGG